MSDTASITFAGVMRFAAPRWSSAPHSDGQQTGPMGVSSCADTEPRKPGRTNIPNTTTATNPDLRHVVCIPLSLSLLSLSCKGLWP